MMIIFGIKITIIYLEKYQPHTDYQSNFNDY